MSAGTGLRVLIADDDAVARRVTKHALQAAGMTVVAEAADGREALALSLHCRPDVVVLEALQAGALDAVPKNADLDALTRALHTARRADATITRGAK